MAWGDNNKDNKGPWGSLGKDKDKQSKPANPWGNLGGGGSSGGSGGSSSGGSSGGNKPPFDFNKFFKPSGNNVPELNINTKGIFIIFLLAVMGWALTGFYIVDASEEGVVTRFGKYHRTATEGLKYHLPSPLEKAYIVKKTIINSIQIGYRSSIAQQSNSATGLQKQLRQQATNSRGPETKQLKESLMITGDTNIADVTFVVQWRIKDSFNYLFKIANPEETMEDTIKAVAESAMREVIGRTNFAEAMTTKRGDIEKNVQMIIQNVLNTYESGVEIYAVNLNDVQNPEPVMPAFLDVETAKQDKETAINRALAYENQIIPQARGDVQKLVQEAEAYKQEVISIASGDAQRFASVYNEYVKAKDITKKRIYLETMQQILAGTDKVIMSEGSNNVVPYLPLPEIKKKQPETSKPDNTNSDVGIEGQ